MGTLYGMGWDGTGMDQDVEWDRDRERMDLAGSGSGLLGLALAGCKCIGVRRTGGRFRRWVVVVHHQGWRCSPIGRGCARVRTTGMHGRRADWLQAGWEPFETCLDLPDLPEVTGTESSFGCS